MSAYQPVVQTGQGIVILVRKIGPFLWPGEWQEAVARWFILGIVGSVALTTVTLHAWTMWAAGVVLVLAGYHAGRPDAVFEDSDEEFQGELGDEGWEAERVVDRAPGPPPVFPVELVAAVRDIGTPNAQLVPLAEHLGTTTDEVRAAAQRMAWAVKDVRMAGRSASAGLRWDECPSPDEVYPSPNVVGAGQPADDNDDDSEDGGSEKGLRVVPLGYEARIIYDPADTIRHHQVRDQ